MMRCSENGVFVGSLYVLQDGELTTAPPVQKTLPEKPGYLFRLTLGLHPDIGDARTVTLDLPAAEAELLAAQEQLGVEGWEGVTVIDYDGIIPYAAEFTDLPMEQEELNAFTKAARDIPRSEVPKLKALLEQFEVQDIETAMLLTEHLADYILMPNLSSPQEAALDQLCFIMNREEAVRLIPYVNLFNYVAYKGYYSMEEVTNGSQSSRMEMGGMMYLQAVYPAADGFSPRNVRRMRAFLRGLRGIPRNHAAGNEPRLDAECGDFREVRQQRRTGAVHPRRAALWLEKGKTAGNHRISGVAAFFSRRTGRFLLY